MSWGFPRGSATHGAPVSGRNARRVANGARNKATRQGNKHTRGSARPGGKAAPVFSKWW